MSNRKFSKILLEIMPEKEWTYVQFKQKLLALCIKHAPDANPEFNTGLRFLLDSCEGRPTLDQLFMLLDENFEQMSAPVCHAIMDELDEDNT